MSGCLTRPIEPIEPQTTSVVVERLTQSGVNKIDLLLDVDNSSSMADKQSILALALPQLVSGLVNPNCLTPTGTIATPAPAGPLDPCPMGSVRDFPPVLDIHIALVSSSLGTFGADGCPDPPATPNPACPGGTTDNDMGHLVTRSDPCGMMAAVPTFPVTHPGSTMPQPSGFLYWNPSPGAPAGSIGTTAALNTAVTSLVTGDGQLGCGFESQNESWYRFLIDPTPYASITLSGQNAVTTGIDNVLLQQRADFLRPDALLSIIVVSDETDTSIKEFGIYPLFAQTSAGGAPFHLPRPTSACATNGPNDPCCASCGEGTPKGCTADPMCSGATGEYSDTTENVSLRAFGLSGGKASHKARYGIEFFYQPSRYVNALTAATVADNKGMQVPNPIYSILPGNDTSSSVRDPGLVFYAAITGVPWQLIARQKNGVPDLINGVSALDPTQVGGFKTSAELNQLDPTKLGTFWDDVVGDPEHYVLPKSPFMQESTVTRSGADPITNTAISPPTAGTLNPINGRDRTIATPAGDIQYACIFKLPTPRDCTQAGTVCDCPSTAGTMTDNPLCDPTTPTMQTYAKAYPGVKNLAVAKGMGNQGIAASICPAQLDTTNPTAPDFGYNPAVAAIIARLKQALHGECLPRTLSWDPVTKEVTSCLILEATKSKTCDCSGPARQAVQAVHMPAVEAAQQDPLAKTAQWNCFCELKEITQNTPPPAAGPLTSCLETVGTVTDTTANGWCYVDAQEGTAEAAVVAKCPASEEHEIRFVGAGAPVAGATLFITCAGAGN